MRIVNEMTDDAVLCEVGKRIAAMRIAARLTQDVLARRAGVSKRSVERLEKGEGGVRLQIIVAVARALRCLGGLDQFVPETKLSPYDRTVNAGVPPKRVRVRKQAVVPFKWKE